MSSSVRNIKGLKLEHIDINTNYCKIYETKDTRQQQRIKPTIKVYHYDYVSTLKVEYQRENDALNNPKICPRLLPEHLEMVF